MMRLLTYQSINQSIDEGEFMNKQKWTEVGFLVVVVASISALATFCLTEYNIKLDCQTIGAFRIDGEGFKCAEVQK